MCLALCLSLCVCAQKVLKEELGEKWRDKLADFDPQPLAAASIGQVHSVVLHSGQPAAMKIQVGQMWLIHHPTIIGLFHLVEGNLIFVCLIFLSCLCTYAPRCMAYVISNSEHKITKFLPQ